MAETCIVIGGGIVGLSTAYFLQKEGFEVKVLDQSAMDRGASYVNAGYLTPSHIVPLAAPGMITKGLKWMFDSSSPFYIKPRLDPAFLRWAWLFKKACTPKHVANSLKHIRDINILSRDLYDDIKYSGDLGEFFYHRDGLLMLYKTEKVAESERQVAGWARDLDLDVRELDQAALAAIQPDVKIDALGGFIYECDGHMTPGQFMDLMKSYLPKAGVTIETGVEALDFIKAGDKVSEVVTSKGNYTADHVILAAGSWSENLAAKLGLYLPVQAGKGYRINVARETGISLPAILMEAKVAVTPMEGFTRFAGTMELSGINQVIRKERVEAIAKAGEAFYPGLKIEESEKAEADYGFRPVSPDGMPFIGRVNKGSNVLAATGHAMMGWSLGPGTGKLITEMITGKPTSMDVSAFDPQRYT